MKSEIGGEKRRAELPAPSHGRAAARRSLHARVHDRIAAAMPSTGSFCATARNCADVCKIARPRTACSSVRAQAGLCRDATRMEPYEMRLANLGTALRVKPRRCVGLAVIERSEIRQFPGHVHCLSAPRGRRRDVTCPRNPDRFARRCAIAFDEPGRRAHSRRSERRIRSYPGKNRRVCSFSRTLAPQLRAQESRVLAQIAAPVG
jgi:hypothetical protein